MRWARDEGTRCWPWSQYLRHAVKGKGSRFVCSHATPCPLRYPYRVRRQWATRHRRCLTPPRTVGHRNRMSSMLTSWRAHPTPPYRWTRRRFVDPVVCAATGRSISLALCDPTRCLMLGVADLTSATPQGFRPSEFRARSTGVGSARCTTTQVAHRPAADITAGYFSAAWTDISPREACRKSSAWRWP